jgi:manganese/zinc/iron transport system permease protein
VGQLLHDLLFDYTLRTVALGSASLGAVSGALGSFAVLRRQSLLGDAISHAALPGIVLAFLLTGSKATLVLVLGAAAAGWVGTLGVMAVVRTTRIPEDSALGIVLSVFFGAGLVLLTWVQRMPTASQAGLDRFLFGQAATLISTDVAVIAGLGALSLGVMAAFWKEFKLLAFDPEFGGSLGIPMATVDVILTTVLVLAIVAGLQTVGVVLMSAMVVAPAAAARQWTDRLGVMVILAGVIGALSGVTGSVVSASATGLPTGPVIVLCVSAVVAVSLLLAPHRGLLWAALERRRRRRTVREDTLLADLHALYHQHESHDHGHPVQVLEVMGPGRDVEAVRRTLGELESRGWAREVEEGEDGPSGWVLTPRGDREAEARLARLLGEDE